MTEPPSGTKPPGVVPAFVFSQPRTGSTLLQRMLAAHPAVSTAAETWLLLPLLFARRRRDGFSRYGHFAGASAVGRFVNAAEDGEQRWDRCVRDLASALYAAALGPGEHVFVDKTPRYYYIVEDVMRIFPDGRFLFLWRNPLATLASIIEIWGDGVWRPARMRDDIELAPRMLASAARAAGAKACPVRFEDLVSQPEAELHRLLDALGVNQDDETVRGMIDGFSGVKLTGNMGDPTGRKKYKSLSSEPLDKWKATICNGLRKRWCKRYLDRLGDDVLETMGYDPQQLHRDLAALPVTGKKTLVDLAAQPRVALEARLKETLFTAKPLAMLKKPPIRPPPPIFP